MNSVFLADRLAERHGDPRVFRLGRPLYSIIGLYGVMGQFIQQRRRDIGVRIALGATVVMWF